ncbi:zinc finger protein 28 [Astyanax mexicanus]|uniref:zinc finger protein 28 n=1 Tax=Astyanax mexicanus TaxID=7994 RepID=UPI0020CB5C66|nr:zinc finger protein 28 [Astyanax mexicanus]
MEIPEDQVQPAVKLKKPRVRTEESWQAKRERDRVLAKTRINIGSAFEQWRELRELKSFRSDTELAIFLLHSISKEKPMAETYYTTPRTDWTSSDESTSSVSESRNNATGIENNSQSSRNGEGAHQQDRAASDVQRKPSCRDEEECSDLSESSYVILNKEVLVTMMFCCLECSGECMVRGKGKGGNLLLRQDCLICRNYRVWTSRPAQIIKEEVADLPVTRADSDAEEDLSTAWRSHGDNSTLEQEDRLDLNAVLEEAHAVQENTQAVPEETQATGSNTGVAVKKEKEDDGEREVESLLMETYEDQVSLSPVQEKSNIESEDFNVTSVTNDSTEPAQTSVTAQKEDSKKILGKGEQGQSENEPKTSDSSSYESTDSSDEERCDKDFTRKRQKIFQNTVKPIYWCVDCGAVAHMQCTVRRHHKIFGCPACGVEDSAEGSKFKGFSVHFSDKESFHKHAMEVHNAVEIPHERTACPDCNKTFRVLQGHVCEYKIKPFFCHLCHKRFATEVGQKVHYRRLHKDYTHLCKFCMAVFDSRASKLDHEQDHSEDELPFLCPDCPEQFKDYITRNEHLKSHRGQKTYPCHKCDRILTSLNGYERHVLTHSGEKPYTCEVCERSFSQAGHLKSHMRLHTGERPFMCEQCGECFNHNVSLKNHLMRRHCNDSAPVSGDESKAKGRPTRKAGRKKRARKSFSSFAAAGELDVELDEEMDYWEESQESDDDGEEKKRRCQRKKWKEETE